MIKKQDKPEIYFHVGLGKAASTFLQYNVFPKFRGLYYIQRTRYRRSPEIISKGKHKKYLMSGELDNRLYEKYIKEFSAHFPHARSIIILRRHDSWIASQYRRYLKNGNPWSFIEFFDISEDKGYWKKKDLFFYPLILILEKYFIHKPMVLFYNDLRSDPEAFIRKIADYTGASVDTKKIDFGHKHSSYNPKQLKAIISVGKRINIRRVRNHPSKTWRVIKGLIPNIIRYSTLYLALILPDSLFSKEELIPPGSLEEIREHYSEDWEACLDYARRNTSSSDSSD